MSAYNVVIVGKDINGALTAVEVDMYAMLDAIPTKCPALTHLMKKAAYTGVRGHKGEEEDLQNIVDSALRAQDLAEGRKLREQFLNMSKE
jgi:hypothetical protein